jgi:hypothetical protein
VTALPPVKDRAHSCVTKKKQAASNALAADGIADLTDVNRRPVPRWTEGRKFPKPDHDTNLASTKVSFEYTILAATGISEAKRINAMAALKTEEEEILTFDISDEALEIAGSDNTNFTYGVCTLDQPGCFPSIILDRGRVRSRNDMRA